MCPCESSRGAYEMFGLSLCLIDWQEEKHGDSSLGFIVLIVWATWICLKNTRSSFDLFSLFFFSFSALGFITGKHEGKGNYLLCKAERGKVMISNMERARWGCKGIYVEIQSCIIIMICCRDILCCIGVFRKAEVTGRWEFVGFFSIQVRPNSCICC